MSVHQINFNNKFKSVTLKSYGKTNTSEVDISVDLDEKDNIKVDLRIILTKYFIAVIFILSIAGIFIANKSVDEVSIVVILFSIMAAVNYIGLYIIRNDIAASLLYSLLSVYIWIAFPLKLMVTLNYPESMWISKILFDAKTVEKDIVGAFISVYPGLLALFIGFVAFHRKLMKKNNGFIKKINHKLFIVIIVFLLVMKLFAQIYLNIGIPNVTPNELPIPYLSGVLSILLKGGLFAFVNLYFYYVIRLNDKKAIWISLFFLIFNIALNLRVGYKSELVLQSILLIYYSFEFFPYVSKSQRKFMLITIVSLLIITTILYPLINSYRSYMLSGLTFSQAIEKVKSRSDANTESIAFVFLNRINGIGEYYAAIKLGEGREISFNALFNNSVMDLIKEKLYGANKAKATVSFGTTLFSVIYLVGGGMLLIILGLLIGRMIRWSLDVLNHHIFKSCLTYSAYLPILCILWVRLLASGGSMLLYVKELFLIVICLALLERYGTQLKY